MIKIGISKVTVFDRSRYFLGGSLRTHWYSSGGGGQTRVFLTHTFLLSVSAFMIFPGMSHSGLPLELVRHPKARATASKAMILIMVFMVKGATCPRPIGPGRGSAPRRNNPYG